jgi:hypothetical protein
MLITPAAAPAPSDARQMAPARLLPAAAAISLLLISPLLFR